MKRTVQNLVWSPEHVIKIHLVCNLGCSPNSLDEKHPTQNLGSLISFLDLFMKNPRLSAGPMKSICVPMVDVADPPAGQLTYAHCSRLLMRGRQKIQLFKPNQHSLLINWFESISGLTELANPINLVVFFWKWQETDRPVKWFG